MRILVNASNLKAGGGLQVADSICMLLNHYSMHQFVVVLSPELTKTGKLIEEFDNVSVVFYSFKKTVKSLLFLRDTFLDSIVYKKKIDAVLTVFGPSRWAPRVPHLCGFARAQILPLDTPYFKQRSLKERLRNVLVKHSFKRGSDYYWTENPAISGLLKIIFPQKHVYTISNNYNQVFDDESKWHLHELPPFNGVTLLTISNSYPHKNLIIAQKVAEILERKHPEFTFRFVLTINESEYPKLGKSIRHHFLFIGTVDVAECPSLYQQSSIMFQPSLLECFTATFPEAMRMMIPIITTDLEYSRGLCGNAAMYYSALSAEDAADKIYELSTNKELVNNLVSEGLKQLALYETPSQRADKIIRILESLVN